MKSMRMDMILDIYELVSFKLYRKKKKKSKIIGFPSRKEFDPLVIKTSLPSYCLIIIVGK